MNMRILIALVFAVAVISGGAYFFSQERQALQSEAYTGGPLLPDLQARVNNVDAVRLQSQEGGVINLVRQGGIWVVKDHYNYRANPDRVSILLKQVATLEKIEPKTAKPQNHARLNLDDPAGENALGTRITLKANGEEVADVVIGLVSPPDHGGGTFVRLFSEDQTWLAKDEVKPRRRLLDLLDRSVVNVDGRRIRSVHIQRSAVKNDEKEPITISKETPSQDKYNLSASIPAGFQPKADHELSSIARVPDFMVLEDVKPATDLKWDHPVETIFETFDGLRLTFRSAVQKDGKVWSSVAAATTNRSLNLDDYIVANKAADTEAGRIAGQMKTPEELAEEVKRLAGRLNGWAYRLTDYKAKRLTATSQEVIEKPEAAERSGTAPRQ
ncbi:MAG: DUF4340 domain-containing protein [Rhodospirillales bacterium]